MRVSNGRCPENFRKLSQIIFNKLLTMWKKRRIILVMDSGKFTIFFSTVYAFYSFFDLKI